GAMGGEAAVFLCPDRLDESSTSARRGLAPNRKELKRKEKRGRRGKTRQTRAAPHDARHVMTTASEPPGPRVRAGPGNANAQGCFETRDAAGTGSTETR